VPTQAPRTNADASAVAPTQAARSIGDASINVARESKAAFKATVKPVAKQIVASVPALPVPPVKQVKRAAADTNSENRSPGTPHISPAVVDSTAAHAREEDTKGREQVTTDLVLPAALPAQPAIKPEENQQEETPQEKTPNEEPYEERKVQPPVNISTPYVARETGRQRSIVVKYGDTLEKLALRHLGSRYALNEIIDDNPQIMDIDRIYPGQKVYLSRSGQTTAGAGSVPRDASQPSPSFTADTSRIDDSKLPGFRDRRKN
jgi:hypothetical protein